MDTAPTHDLVAGNARVAPDNDFNLRPGFELRRDPLLAVVVGKARPRARPGGHAFYGQTTQGRLVVLDGMG